MSEAKDAGLYTLLSPVVMAHPSLFEARAFAGKDGKPKPGSEKYGAQLTFEPTSEDLKNLKALAVRLARAEWGAEVDLKTIRFPFKNGDTLADKRKAKSGKDDGDFQRGKVVMPARSKFPPRLSGIENGQIVDYSDDAKRATIKGKFYFGVQVLAEVNLVAMEVDEKRGVTVYLNQVLTTNKGTKIAGGKSAAETFKGYVGSSSNEDPTAGMDDEIPF